MSLAFGPVDIFQVFGEAPQILAEVLQDGVNLAVWRRRLPAQLQDFAELVLSLGQPLTDQRVIEVHEQHAPSCRTCCAKPLTCMAMSHL